MTAMASSPLTPKDQKSAPPLHHCRRRIRSTSFAATNTNTTSSFSSSILYTPSPSHYFIQTPFHCSSSSIPFSWEQTPGIPKMPSKNLKSHQTPRLPLPPPLRSDSFNHKKNPSAVSGVKLAKLASAVDVDPFAVALIECAKDPPAESDLWIGSRSAAGAKTGRRPSIGDRFGFGFGLGRLDLNGSCKTSCSVSESTVEIPRVGRRVETYRVMNRRIG